MKLVSLISMILLLSLEVSAQRKLISQDSTGSSENSMNEAEYGKATLNHDKTTLYFVKTYDFNSPSATVTQSIWEAPWNNNQDLNGASMTEVWNDLNNNGVVGVSQDGNRIYLLGTYSKKDRLWPGLSVSERVDGEWSLPQKVEIDKLHLRSGMFDFHVTEDEGAIFITMGNSYYGQLDIYVSQRMADLSWSKPIPLTAINTDTTQEISPFFSTDFNTLYFASDRSGGVGGFDIYSSERGSEWTEWDEPTILPRPYNSDMFDAYFTAYKDVGAFVVSNRDDALSKIFYFSAFEQEKREKEEKESMDSEVLALAEDEFTDIIGQFKYEGLPKKGVEILLLDENRNLLKSTTTNRTGEYEFLMVPIDESHSLVYVDAKDNMNPELANLEEQDNKETVAVQNIDGVFTYDGEPRKNTLIVLLNDEGEIIDRSTTTSKGFYQFNSKPADQFYSIVYVDESDEYEPDLANLDEFIDDVENKNEFASVEETTTSSAVNGMLLDDEYDNEISFSDEAIAFAEEQGYTQQQLQKMTPEQLRRLFAEDISLVYNEDDPEAEGEMFTEEEYAFAEEQGYTQQQLQKMSADQLKRLFAKDIALNYTEEEEVTEATPVNGMLLDDEYDNEISFSDEAIAFAEEQGYTQQQLQKMTPEQLRRLFAEDISLVYNEDDPEAEGEMFTEEEYAFAEEQGYTQQQLQKMSADQLKRLFAKDIALNYTEEEEVTEATPVNGMLLDDEYDNEISFSDEAIAFAEEQGYTQQQLQKMTPEQLRRLFAEDISLVYNEDDPEAEGEMFTEEEYAFAEEQGYTQQQLQKMSADQLKRLFAKDIALNYTEEEEVTEATPVNGMLLDDEYDNEISFSDEAIAFAEEQGYTQQQLQKMTPEQLRRLFAEDISLVYNEDDPEAEGEMFTEEEYAFAEEQGYTQQQLQKMSADQLKRLFAKDIALNYTEEEEVTEATPVNGMLLDDEYDNEISFSDEAIAFAEEQGYTQQQLQKMTPEQLRRLFAEDISLVYNEDDPEAEGEMFTEEEYAFAEEQGYTQQQLQKMSADQLKRLFAKDIALNYTEEEEVTEATPVNGMLLDDEYDNEISFSDEAIAFAEEQGYTQQQLQKMTPEQLRRLFAEDISLVYNEDDPEAEGEMFTEEEYAFAEEQGYTQQQLQKMSADQLKRLFAKDIALNYTEEEEATEANPVNGMLLDDEYDNEISFSDEAIAFAEEQGYTQQQLQKMTPEQLRRLFAEDISLVYNEDDPEAEGEMFTEEEYAFAEEQGYTQQQLQKMSADQLKRLFAKDISLVYNEEVDQADEKVEELDNNSRLVGQFIYDTKTRRNVLVVLLDEENQILNQTYTDHDGKFEFDSLSSLKSHKALYIDQDDVFDPNLANLEELDQSALPPSFAAIPLMHTADVTLEFDQFIIESEDDLPDDATAYMTDLSTDEVSSVSISSDGSFQFNHLSRGDDYELSFSENIESENTKVYNTYLEAKQELQMTDDGIVPIKPEMLYPDIALDIAGLSDAIASEYKSNGNINGHFLHNDIPERDALIVLLDDENSVVDQTYTDRFGRYEFSSLSPAGSYIAYYVDEDNVFDPDRSNLREINTEHLPPNFTAIPLQRTSDIELDFNKFSLKYEDEIPSDAKAYMTDLRTDEVSEAEIASDGTFKFDQLNLGDDYELSFSDNLDNEKITVFNNQGDEEEELAITEDGFVAVKPQMIYPDIVLDQALLEKVIADGYDNTSSLGGRFIYDTKTRRNVLVVLVDEEDHVLNQTFTDQNGQFKFDSLSSLQSYKAMYVDQDDVFDPNLANLQELDENDLPPSFAGIPLLQNSDIALDENITDAKENAESKELEVSFLNTEEKTDEPYPLTPPEDENEVSITVEKGVVNNTVFEDPPVKEEPKVKMAKATADYSDFRLKDGSFAEVVQTRKGWNLHFDFNKFILSRNQLDYVYQVLIPLLRKNPDLTLILEGHTDSIGSNEVNYRMSILRISNVLYHLEMNGIEDTRITVRPKGKTEPIAPNSTPEGRAINRRVEIEKED